VKVRAFRLAIACLLLTAGGAVASEPESCGVPPQAAVAAPRLADAAARAGRIRIVALGSSSTAGAGASGPAHAYPARLEERLRRGLPGLSVTVVNRGAGGEDASHMLARIEAEVIAERPDLVIWQAGANAALRGMDPERFRAAMLEGLVRLRRAGIEVVLMDNQRAPRIAARAGHRVYDGILAEVAASAGVHLFSRGALMDALARRGVPEAVLLSPDGLHHNDRGYDCIAEGLAEALIAGLLPRDP